MSTVVDVYCHVFNAADLPVKGFVHRLHLRNAALGGLLSGLVDTLIQGAAPSFEADLGRLNTLLGGGYGGPDDWLPVLAAHPRLRLNLGHFGGAQQTEPADGWPWRMAQAMADHPGLFADVGNHRIHDPAIRVGYAETLRSMRAGAATRSVAERVMYGSDWYMLALYPDDDLFLERYLTLFAGFGDEARDAFSGRNALRFLGFDDPQNRNAQRLSQRYERYAPANVAAWLAR
ncbi:amidohydrolase family protein [Dactylosporangium sp. CA-152071]|uniref:amidohydrolase family protein n=1 Tax=Dactylosporangium sp. CA-152071 TaxID=3239933 RepID=UPI003D9048C5